MSFGTINPSSIQQSQPNLVPGHDFHGFTPLPSDLFASNPDITQQLPKHACKYCGLAENLTVVQCLDCSNMGTKSKKSNLSQYKQQTPERWFCNCSSSSSSASHIVHHLVRAKHKSIVLHPQSHLGGTTLECYNCGNRNIFMMGFLPAQGQSVVALLCRNCLGAAPGKFKQIGWSLESWMPVIQDRRIISWLVSSNNENVDIVTPFSQLGVKITTTQLNKLEDLWKTQPNATLLDLRAKNLEEDLVPVQLKYEDGFHYQRVFEPLVRSEADYDKEMKESLYEDNVKITWRHNEKVKRISALFVFSSALSESLRITIGDEMKIVLSHRLNPSYKLNGQNKDWESTGTVVGIEEGGEITLELRSLSGNIKNAVPMHITEGYQISFVWKPITFDRMQAALKTFANNDKSVSGYLYHKLLGHNIQEQILPTTNTAITEKVKNLPRLNASQIEAIKMVLHKPLSLVQGPPGSGKTVTCAALIYHMVKRNPTQQVLVTAPSNVAVDQLTEKIEQTGLRVVRVSAKSREHLESIVEKLNLHNIITSLNTESSKRLKQLLEKKQFGQDSSKGSSGGGNQLSHKDMKELNLLRKKLERTVLKNAQVICTTCSGAGDPRLVAAGLKFSTVLLDEATQATEPESLIPIVLGCKQFVLVGDHRQLVPVVMCKKAANAGLNSSLFERLVKLGLRIIRLRVQYRMHPALSEFPSNSFYEGSLQNGVTKLDRSFKKIMEGKENVKKEFPWPNEEKPMFFYSCLGAEEIAGTGTSYLNRTEAANCEKVVTGFMKSGITPDQIGVITPYEGQRAYIVQHMQRAGTLPVKYYKQIEVSSVDAFQGREKDFIILSCVRSNERQGIGFLNDPRRLNVALTRAKYGLVVLGNPRVLSKRPLWAGLLKHFQDQHLLVEGPLNSLRECNIRISSNVINRKEVSGNTGVTKEHMERVFSGDKGDPFGEGLDSVIAPKEDSRFDNRYGGARHPLELPPGTTAGVTGLDFTTDEVKSQNDELSDVGTEFANLDLDKDYGDLAG
eukprot:snap_masked-scaffold_2-processed-gene-14.29-mRNA-1 protein AED:0.20 eAED:0.22 QI:0/0/0/1/1/1/3/0/1016